VGKWKVLAGGQSYTGKLPGWIFLAYISGKERACRLLNAHLVVVSGFPYIWCTTAASRRSIFLLALSLLASSFRPTQDGAAAERFVHRV
jgi:hypothetical protein